MTYSFYQLPKCWWVGTSMRELISRAEPTPYGRGWLVFRIQDNGMGWWPIVWPYSATYESNTRTFFRLSLFSAANARCRSAF